MSFDPGDFYPEGSGGTPPGPGPGPATDFIRRGEFTEALAGKVATDDPRLSDARTPTAHTHGQSDVTGLPAALAAKLSRQEAEDGFTEWTLSSETLTPSELAARSVVWNSQYSTWDLVETAFGVVIASEYGNPDDVVVRFIDTAATRTRLRPTPEMESAWNNKQDAIADLAAIRSGAALGATAVQPGALRYELFTYVVSGAENSMRDRTCHAFTATSDVSDYNFSVPVATQGRARDLMLFLTVEDSGSHTFTFSEPDGISPITILFGSSELSKISRGRNLILLTEVAADRWLVSVRHEDFTAAELAALEGGNE